MSGIALHPLPARAISGGAAVPAEWQLCNLPARVWDVQQGDGGAVVRLVVAMDGDTYHGDYELQRPEELLQELGYRRVDELHGEYLYVNVRPRNGKPEVVAVSTLG